MNCLAMRYFILREEFRAFHNLGWHRNAAKSIVGLTGYGPNINILRDPRFGRASELPGKKFIGNNIQSVQ